MTGSLMIKKSAKLKEKYEKNIATCPAKREGVFKDEHSKEKKEEEEAEAEKDEDNDG